MGEGFLYEFWNEKIAVTLTRNQWTAVSVVLEQEIKKVNELIDRLHRASLERDDRGEPVFKDAVGSVRFWEEQIDAYKAFLAAYESAKKRS